MPGLEQPDLGALLDLHRRYAHAVGGDVSVGAWGVLQELLERLGVFGGARGKRIAVAVREPVLRPHQELARRVPGELWGDPAVLAVGGEPSHRSRREVTSVALRTVGAVPGVDDSAFQAAAQEATEGCP